ncbi:hypothetical protein DPEC_G00331060 [Dallia pectoralis]|uniref:Uncharacterized protein n=1 Tax=Dallia pectoralis TaxID=75939 RepID=A0ACC2F9F4_DALPE|nr:hypothetical protein DPEC_G00331060 [Dallia pectoralis]
MATSITGRVFALYRKIPSIITQQLKCLPVCMGEINPHSHCPRSSYGNRPYDNPKDRHVNIPVDRLTVSYSRSSGPGGQHVNKVSTKAEARFHIHTAEWIPEDVRKKIILKNKNRINKAGELLVTSERSRSQVQNLNDCIQKISDIIAEASVKPCEPSAEDIALRASRLEKRNKERLEQKKLHSKLRQTVTGFARRFIDKKRLDAAEKGATQRPEAQDHGQSVPSGSNVSIATVECPTKTLRSRTCLPVACDDCCQQASC